MKFLKDFFFLNLSDYENFKVSFPIGAFLIAVCIASCAAVFAMTYYKRTNNAICKQLVRHGAIGVCDWNLILDAVEGGPYHCRTTGGCAAALYYDEKTHGVITDGIYGVIKTIVGEIERGDVVVTTTSASSALCEVAVKKQDGSVILFVLNTSGEDQEVNVRMNGRVTAFTLPANSLSANFIA